MKQAELFTKARANHRPAAQRGFAERLGLDYGRILSWAFCQAFLSRFGALKTDLPKWNAMNPALRLASHKLQYMLRTFQPP
jgi:hypothetical protein